MDTSNFFAGLIGTMPNYLVDVNTLLCVRWPSSISVFPNGSVEVPPRKGNYMTFGLYISAFAALLA